MTTPATMNRLLGPVAAAMLLISCVSAGAQEDVARGESLAAYLGSLK